MILLIHHPTNLDSLLSFLYSRPTLHFNTYAAARAATLSSQMARAGLALSRLSRPFYRFLNEWADFQPLPGSFQNLPITPAENSTVYVRLAGSEEAFNKLGSVRMGHKLLVDISRELSQESMGTQALDSNDGIGGPYGQSGTGQVELGPFQDEQLVPALVVGGSTGVEDVWKKRRAWL